MSGDPDLPGGTSEPEERAAELFAAFLARREAGEELELEELCAAHPDLAQELRALFGHWSALQRALGERAPGGSLAERIRRLHGLEADPTVILEPEPEREQSPSSELLERLAGRRGLFGRYRLKGEVARGGMGAILRVWDEDLKRTLAMKVVLGRGGAAKHETPPVEARTLARFLEEAQVTGQLDHPGIVPVHELGLDEQGRVYFTMKLVKGKTLAAVFDELGRGAGEWTRARALGALQKACDALAYAHAKGVVHRDLKPANVMVGRYGEVYVMDWGLARVMGRKDAKDVRIRPAPVTASEVVTERRERAGADPGSPLCTMDGDVVGTPAYMPPEQARGNLEEIGPHSDVYALGAMLYHLLSGQMPYVPPDATLNAYAIWARVQEGPPRSLAELARDAPAELVAIADKAMARDWRARYRDMAELARDLSAFLEGRVVRAYESGAWAEGRKWVRRNRPLAVALAAAVLLLVVGLATSLVLRERALESAVLAESRREQAQASSRLAEERRTQAEESRAFAEEQRARADEARTLAEERRTQTEGALALAEERRVAAEESERRAIEARQAVLLRTYVANLSHARAPSERGDAATAARYLADCPEELRGFEWRSLRLASDASLWRFPGDAGSPSKQVEARRPRARAARLGFAPDGSRLVSCDALHLHLFDSQAGTELARLSYQSAVSDAVRGAVPFALTADGTRIVTMASSRSNGDGPWRGPSETLAHPALAFCTVDMSTGALLDERPWPQEGVWGLAIDSAGSRFVTAASRDDRSPTLWDARTGERIASLEGHPGEVSAIAFADDGTRLATWTAEDAILRSLRQHDPEVGDVLDLHPPGRIWNARTGELVAKLEGWSTQILAFGPRGGPLASSSSRDGDVRLWNPESGAPLARLRRNGREGSDHAVEAMCFDPDGGRLATGARDGALCVWDVAKTQVLAVCEGRDAPVRAVVFSRDGYYLASASADGYVQLWDADTGAAIAAWLASRQPVAALAFHADGERIACVAEGGEVSVWDAHMRESSREWRLLPAYFDGLLFSPDGRAIACRTTEGPLLLDGATGAVTALIAATSGSFVQTRPSCSLAFSPDGARIATTSRVVQTVAVGEDGAQIATTSGTARLWEVQTGKLLAILEHREDSPRRMYLTEEQVRLRERPAPALRDTVVLGLLATFGKGVNAVAFSPDGARIATGSGDGTLWIWDAGSGALLVALQGHGDVVRAVAFSPDGTRIATTAFDDTGRLWDAHALEPLATLEGANRIVFAPRGERLAAVFGGGTLQLFDARTGEVLWVADHEDVNDVLAFRPDGERLATACRDGTLRVFDARTGATLAVLSGHTGSVNDLAFSPDGRRILSGSKDRTVRIWDAESGAELAVLASLDAAVRGVAFSPDGTRVVAAADDGTLFLLHSELDAARRMWLELEVERLTASLLDQHVLPERALAALRARPLGSAALHDAVRARIEATSVSASSLYEQSWEIARSPDRSPQEYGTAVWLAAAALELQERPGYALALALAQYRAELYEQALATLERVDAFGRVADSKPALVPIVAAMCHARLGRLERARELLAEGRAAVEERESAPATTLAQREELRELLAESAALLE